MRVFSCGTCGRLVYFESSRCERCDSELGFLSDTLEMATLRPRTHGGFEPLVDGAAPVQRCVNAVTASCNWMTPIGAPVLCASCALAHRIPDLDVRENLPPWREAQAAQRRLVCALLRFRLPLTAPSGSRLTFAILSDAEEPSPVMTGHKSGVITINLAEADPTERERRRNALGEVYRTLLGHFRHEVGHFYWDALVRDGGRIAEFRAVFGDESAAYSQALRRYYQNGAPRDWQLAYVSPYATMHPWEDFAETWAHYLHIVDALDTAEALGIGVDPGVTQDPAMNARIVGDPYRTISAPDLIADWLPLSYAVNSLNRSLGQPDFYPFVLSPAATTKLGFVHDLVRPFAQG